jgi:tight adherence protein B
MPIADIILTAGIGTTFVILVLALLLDARSRQKAQMNRIELVRARTRRELARTSPGDQPNVKVSAAPGSALGQAAARWLPRQETLRQRLAQTGRDISPGRYGTAVLLCILAAFAVAALAIGLPYPVAALLGVAVGVWLPHIVVGRMVTRRAAKFVALFPDAIELMVRGLRSGLPISETVGTVGKEMADPVGIEFRRASDAVRLGQTMEDALWAASRRIAAPEFKFFVISLAIQRETGGNLAETLSNLADIIRQRKQMRLKIKALSSEARASAYILGSLPFVLFGILLLINPGYAMQLFTDPRGTVALGVGLGLISLAVFTMYKMVKFEI